MDLLNLQYTILFTSMIFLFAQLLVKHKQTAHILFAIFCGSIAMTMARKITGQSIGNYQYLIGMAACATCNCYWLLARSLFRKGKSFTAHHLLFASAIALLIMSRQGYLFANNAALLTSSTSNITNFILTELTVLLSSCVLVLSFWEGCRGFKSASKKEKNQRVLFLSTFGGAVAFGKVSQAFLINSPQAQELVTACIILFVLTNTQILMFWQYKKTKSQTVFKELQQVETNSYEEDAETEHVLAKQVKTLLIDGSWYLQPNLKVADIARELDVPEYRISKALRNELNARNFNQYVNELRINHAQTLLADPNKEKWSVLVVGLESGFATVGPFARAFKLFTGSTPNQYRQLQLK